MLTTEAHPATHASETSTTTHPPAEHLSEEAATEENLKHPTKAAGHMVGEIITFGDTAERLLEVMLAVHGLSSPLLPFYEKISTRSGFRMRSATR